MTGDILLLRHREICHARLMPIPVISIAQMREWEAATWATGQTEAVRARLERDLSGFVAPVFEQLSRDWIVRAGASGALPLPLRAVGRWWTRQAEIDVVALGEEGALLGECKWSTRPVGLGVLSTLRARSELFRGETGMGPDEPLRLALFSKSGFTPDLLAEAEAEGVLLATAEDVVAASALTTPPTEK